MCGITGFWKLESIEGKAETQLQNMLNSITHRGPDGFGKHIDNENNIALGHSRLSIIDLNTGDQPLYSEDRSIVLIANGELYDYKRLRAELRLKGKKFTTKSDSEIAIPLYELHDLEFVEYLRGEFAIALFDSRKKRLVLLRDRFGIKPLYYHISERGIYFGSEIKSLFANEDVPRKFSSKDVLNQLMHTMVPGTTAYEGVECVNPGDMVIVDLKNGRFDIRKRKYWDMDFPKDGEWKEPDKPDYHIKQVQDKLIEAVRFRLEADVPVGCYLSGGIDSCSMLGLASSIQQSPVKAFTISFDDKDYDESAIAAQMAQSTNADQEVINLKAADLYGENYIKTMWHAERTFYNTLGVAKYCMSKRVNECGYKTVVTGEGSDELFGGYPMFKRDMFLHGLKGDQTISEEYYRQMESSNKLFKGAILSDLAVGHPAFDELCGFTPSWIQPWMQTLEIARPLLSDGIQEEIADYDPIQAIVETLDPGQLEGRHPLDKTQYTWIKTMLEGQILNWGGDRVDMANSMESRPAFLDHHVAEIARDIPPKMRIKGNIEKWVLREAMKEILPEVLYKREKFAFMAPPAHTNPEKKAALNNLIETYINPDRIREVGVFDEGRLTEFIELYRADTDPVSLVRKDALMNHILGLHILHDQFNLA